LNHSAGGAMDLVLPSNGFVTTTTANSTPSILAGWATVAKSDFAVVNAGNIGAFAGYVNNDFSTPTNDVDVTGPSVSPGSKTVNSLRFNDAGGTTVADTAGDTLTVSSGGVLVTPNSGGVTFSQATLNAGVGELFVHQNSSNPVVINSSINGGPLTKTGTGAITLAAAGGNTFSNLIVDGGTVNYSVDNQLGSGANGVTLNGGTLSYTGTGAITLARVLTAGPAGATINIANSGAGGGGAKINIVNTNIFAGTGSITLTGNGILSITGNNAGLNNATQNYSGAGWVVNGSTLEFAAAQTGSATGTSAAGTFAIPVNVNSGGEVAIKANLINPLNVNGGTIGVDTGGTANYNGAVSVTANSSIRMGDFFDSTNHNVTIAGPISGSGNLTVINAIGSTASNANPTPAPTANFNGNLLNFSGNNSLYTGLVNVGVGHEVRFTNLISIVNYVIGGTPQAAPVITFGFNTNPNGLGQLPPLNLDPTGSADGVVGPAGFTSNQTFNMAAIGNGNWYLGSDNGGGSSFGTLLPGNGNIYRITGGGSGTTGQGGLFIGGTNNLNDQNGQSIPVVIGDTRVGVTGEVRYGAKMGNTGSTTVNAGSFLVTDYSVPAANTTNLYPAASQLILAGGTFATIGHANSTNSQAFTNGVIINPGQAQIVANNNSTANLMLIAMGAITRNAGGTLDFVLPANGTLSPTNGITTTNTNTAFPGGSSPATIVGGYATVSGANWAMVNTDGTIAPFTAYASDFSVSGNDVSLAATTALTGDTVVNSLRFAAAAAVTLDTVGSTNNLTIASGGILETSAVGANSVTINAGTITSNNGQDLIIIQNNPAAGGTMALSSTLVDNNGPVGLTKSGSGGLQLNNANSYTGDTNLNNGNLAIGNSLALQNSTLSYNIVNGSSVSITGNVTAATIGGLKGDGNLSSNNASGVAVALTIGGNNASTSYSGVISGAGNLTKTGTGTLALGNAQTYTGGTIVAAGTLQLGIGANFGGVVGDIANNGVVAFNRSDVSSFTGVISGTGSVTENGPGTTVLAANNSYAGGTTINGGTLSVASDAKLGQAGTSVTLNGGTLATTGVISTNRNVAVSADSTVSAGANLTLTGTVTGVGALTKNGAGKLTVPGVTLGGLNVAAGSMAVAANGHSVSQLAASVSGGGTLTVGDNTAATTAQLDLNDNDLIVNYTTSSPAATIGLLIKTGYNGGAWNGNGITSSAAASNPGHALGYGDATDLGLTKLETDAGTPVISGSAAVVKYTYNGDSSLDGKVDLGNDFNLFLQGFLSPQSVTAANAWELGDYNYSGAVTTDDFQLFVDGFKTQGGNLGALDSVIGSSALLSTVQKSALLSVVPEPSTMAVLAMAGAGLMTRRRRK
jgi:fibronectin-binding autotransporter adhesin